jgi:hypothetical protein
MLFYRFPEAFVREHGALPPSLSGDFRGLIGCVMLVDYHHSPVGPYGELLFIPGLFRTLRGLRFSITRIWVDSEPSMHWGRRNWAIPKERASFQWTQGPGRQKQVEVSLGGKGMLNLEYRTHGPRIPVHTGLLPIHLIQPEGEEFLEVSPQGQGRGQWARLSRLDVQHPDLPDIGRFRPLAALRVTNFQMVFPPALRLSKAGMKSVKG